MVLTLSACGGDDGGSEESEAPTTLAEIESCLQEAGFETEQNTLAANPVIGLVGDIGVQTPAGTPGGLNGFGYVTVLEFETDAEAAEYAAAGVGDESSGKFVIDISDDEAGKQSEGTAAVIEAVHACGL